jgi:hypothetical protein
MIRTINSSTFFYLEFDRSLNEPHDPAQDINPNTRLLIVRTHITMRLLHPYVWLPVLAFISAPCAASLDTGESSWSIGEEVKTSAGKITGHASKWQSQVSEYLGIPFAKPPTGTRRFAAPQPFVGNSSLVASNFVSSSG